MDNRSLDGNQVRWAADVIAVSNSVLTGLAAAQRAGAMFATYRGFPADPGIEDMRRRRAQFDQDMVQYGRSAGLLEQMRPVAGFVNI